ncbi:MAG: Ig-like domain-containing protein [Clostridia bacterium]|nr:Ig-like domain-containing protein [Clostridia bacterium]
MADTENAKTESAAENRFMSTGKNKIGVKQLVIILVSCPLIVILLCSAAIVYTVHHLEPEKTEEVVDPLAGTVLPEGTDMSIAQFCAYITGQTAKSTDIKASTGTDVSFRDFSGDFPDSVFSLINHVGGQLNGGANGKYESQSVGYGEPCTELLDISAFAEEADDAQGEYNADNHKYRYTFNIPLNAKCIVPFFDADEEMLEKCKKDCAAYADFTDGRHTPTSATAYYEYDSVNEQFTYFELVREYEISVNAAFKNYLDVFGSGTLSFVCRVSTRYNITHAGIFIKEDELRLTKHGFQTLSVSANVADEAQEGTDFTVEFFSSDESIAKADANGMVEAVRVSETPVTVTARLTYLGKMYEDSCTVYITDED